MRLSSAKYLVKQGFSSVWSNRVNSFASFCIISISLVMIGLSVLLSANITRIIGAIEDRNEVIVIILDGTPYNNIISLGEEIKKNDNIFEINFYSKEQAWEDMLNDMSDSEKDLFNQYIDQSPYPDSYRVRIKDISKLNGTVNELKSLSFVQEVKAPSDFAALLVSVRKVLNVMFGVITVALVIVSFVIISNATRQSVYARRREINIMRYVGASKSFIKIPFFVEGLVIGILAAGVGFGFTWFGYTRLYDILTQYLRTWNFISDSTGLIPFTDVVYPVAICYVVCGLVVSSFGTVLSTRKHLNV